MTSLTARIPFPHQKTSPYHKSFPHRKPSPNHIYIYKPSPQATNHPEPSVRTFYFENFPPWYSHNFWGAWSGFRSLHLVKTLHGGTQIWFCLFVWIE